MKCKCGKGELETQSNGLLKCKECGHSYIRLVKTTGTVKIGRNDKCPCGSGKKFKVCDHAEYLKAKEKELNPPPKIKDNK